MRTEKKDMLGITDEEYIELTFDEYLGLILKEKWKTAVRSPAYIMCTASAILFIIVLVLI